MGFGYSPPASSGSGSSSGLIPSNNLSDLTNAGTARTNLGLGTAAVANTTAFEAAGNLPVASSMFANKSLNLSDLSNAGTARTNLGLGTAAVANTSAFEAAGNLPIASSMFANKSLNLSDLASASTARTNLGLGTMGIRASGEYLAAANNLSELSSAATARTNLGLTNMSIWTVVPVASGGTNLTSLPTANYVLGVNSGGTEYEGKNIVGGAGIGITNSTGQIKFDKFNTPTSGTAINLNMSNFLYKVMNADTTFTAVSGTFGQDFQIMVQQDTVGNRTVTWFNTIRWITSGGTAPTIASGVNKVTYLGFRVTGTNTYDGFLIGSNT